MTASKMIYSFGNKRAEGSASMKNLLGGKGANLAEMSNLGISVPPGFTITTESCQHYYDNQGTFPANLKEEVTRSIQDVETMLNKKFGDSNNPLLFSVRSGARVSMPGMMDTVLNIGMNDKIVQFLAKSNPKFAYDSYRRFIQMYGNVVKNIDHYLFEDALHNVKIKYGVTSDTDLNVEQLQEIINQYFEIYKKTIGQSFPSDVYEQLFSTIEAVFKSWMTSRAITYRKIHDIPHEWGTAVNIQSMVFGNMNDDSATGVLFTRNPSTGENQLFGEYLINAQGEDVVAGIRTPNLILSDKKSKNSMNFVMPELYDELYNTSYKLEKHYCDIQDIEFTIENGRLWILQTRNAKRSIEAAIQIAFDMVKEKLITKSEAIMRIDANSISQLLHPRIDANAKIDILDTGLPASPGAATGEIVFTANDAESKANLGHDVILVRVETSPDDIHGMNTAKGILTSKGGMTSHAAVVARGLGTPCICGAESIIIDYAAKTLTIKDKIFHEGDIITIDGGSGKIIAGKVEKVRANLSPEFLEIMSWLNEYSQMAVRANADTEHDAITARKFGAVGIGLCRTEHMFFEESRLNMFRKMIFADNTVERIGTLKNILTMQQEDFYKILKAMEGYPVTIRLLDPPLHEFLPHTDSEITKLASFLNVSEDKVRTRIKQLHESNPMLGHRGCRLAITYPEIYEMQAEAILKAANDLYEKENIFSKVEIMVPLVIDQKEFDFIANLVKQVANSLNNKIEFLLGTMIEIPRAALNADKIAQTAEFFSFGTNDLTQTTLGLSRDDAAKFLPIYASKNILADPFVSIDIEGVGELVKIATQKSRDTNPNIKLGVCGEHGGDARSVKFFESLGMNYVSCSPYRVPIARIASAQSYIESQNK